MDYFGLLSKKMSNLVEIIVAAICAVIVSSVVGPTVFAVLYLVAFTAVILSSALSVNLSKSVYDKRLLLVPLFAVGALIAVVPVLAEPISPIVTITSPGTTTKPNSLVIGEYPDLCFGGGHVERGCTIAYNAGGLSDYPPVIDGQHGIMNASYVFSYSAVILAPASTTPLDGFFSEAISLRVNTTLCQVQQCWMHVGFDTDYPVDFVHAQGMLTMNNSLSVLTLWPSVHFTFPPRDNNVQLIVSIVTCISKLKEENPCIHWQAHQVGRAKSGRSINPIRLSTEPTFSSISKEVDEMMRFIELL